MENKKLITAFVNLRKIKPITEWDDIKEGEYYHIPPLLYNKRFDFLVVEKKENSMKVKKNGDNYNQTIFRTDITSRFIVKQQKYGET